MVLTTGDLVVATIGSANRRSFRVIGDTVNLASLLEGANNAYNTSILVDGKTFQLAQNDVEAREIDFLTVAGRVEPSARVSSPDPPTRLRAGPREPGLLTRHRVPSGSRFHPRTR